VAWDTSAVLNANHDRNALFKACQTILASCKHNAMFESKNGARRVALFLNAGSCLGKLTEGALDTSNRGGDDFASNVPAKSFAQFTLDEIDGYGDQGALIDR
jgi:hypothetical protein